MSSFFAAPTHLPDIYGDDNMDLIDESDWKFDGQDQDDEKTDIAGHATHQAHARTLSTDYVVPAKLSSHVRSEQPTEIKRPNTLTGSAAPRAQARPLSTSSTAAEKQFKLLSGNGLPANLKRPGSLFESVAANETVKRRKLVNLPLPQRPGASSLGARDTATPIPPSSSSMAYKPVRNIFIEDSDSSDDDKLAMPAPKQPSPEFSILSARRIYEPDKQAALAKSRALREKAEKDRLAQHGRASVRPSPAPSSVSKTFQAHILSRSSSTIASKPSGSRSRLVTTPPPRNRVATKNPSPRTLGRPNPYIRDHRHKDARRSVQSKPKPGEVISLDSDDESNDGLAGSSRLNFVRQATRPREIAREKTKASLLSKQPVNGSSTFTERLREVKQEHPRQHPVPSRPIIQPSIEVMNEIFVGIETDRDKQERLSAAAAQVAAERLDRERQRGADHFTVAAGQERRQKQADDMIRRQQEELGRAQKLEEARVHQAQRQRLREQMATKQRLEQADAERNKALDDQLRVQREEVKKKKAAAAAEAAKKRAEDDARQELARQECTELAKRAPVLDEQAQRDRDERIRIKKERAARNKQSQRDDDDNTELVAESALNAVLQPKSLAAMMREARNVESPAKLEDCDDGDPQAATYTPTPNLLQRPMSLNSAAGVRALHHRRPLGEILYEDAKLLQWRDTGDPWPAIVNKFEELTGKKRAEETLRRRYHQVSKALNEAGVGQDLKRRIAAKDEEAREQVNARVNSDRQVSDVAGSTTPKGVQISASTIAQQVQASDKAAPALGEIISDDMHVVRWRDQGKTWAEIVSLEESRTGKRRSDTKVRRRGGLVAKVLKLADISEDLKEALANGDEGAKRQINTKIHGQWPVTKKAATLATGTNNLTSGTVPPGSVTDSLGEILPIDALLVRWRREKMRWDQVIENYDTATGVRKGIHLLKPRHDEVEAALRDALVYDDEIDALSVDEPGARANVNRKVYTIWPPMRDRIVSADKPTAMARARPPKMPTDVVNYGEEQQPSTPTPGTTTAFLPHDTVTGASVQQQYYMPTPGSVAQEQRPTTGGKTINWEFLKMLMTNVEEVYADLPDTESDYISEIDEDEPRDSFYYFYRVERREYTVEDEENGIEIQDVDWRECRDFENLDEANEFASKEISQQVPGCPDFQEGNRGTDYNVEDGYYHLTLTNEAVGRLDVRVIKKVHTPDERLPPKSKEGWLHNSLYHVMECVTHEKETNDDVLGEKSKEVSVHEVVVRGTYTSYLPEANKRAITHFVRLTAPKSIRLDKNSIEQANRIECILAELQETSEETGEEIEYRGTHEEGRARKVEVWVQREKLSGPRNLFKFSK